MKNNNPGNIERTATKWQGMAANQSSDPRFIVFTDAKYGIRAIARTLINYHSVHNISTVRGFIDRWAPPFENPTAAYITSVSHALGVGPDDPIDIDSADVMRPIINAIIAVECAGYVYPQSVIDEGMHLAGIDGAPKKALVQQPGFIAQAGAAVSVAGTAAAQAAPHVKSWADQIAVFSDAPLMAHVHTVLLTAAGGLTMVAIAATVINHRKTA